MAWATIEQLDTMLGSRADDFTTEEKQAALDLATLTLDSVTTCEVVLEEIVDSGLWLYHKQPPPPNAGEIRTNEIDRLYLAEVDDDAIDHSASWDVALASTIRIVVGELGASYWNVLAGVDAGDYRELTVEEITKPWPLPEIPQGTSVTVEWVTIGLPVDGRFQLATAMLASQLLTAAPVVVGGTITSESLGDYRYTLDGARSTAAVLDVANDPNLVALIGWCLPQRNYSLTISREYAATCDCASFGVACDCRYSAHGYGCPCPIDYRSTHYPYPARSVRV